MVIVFLPQKNVKFQRKINIQRNQSVKREKELKEKSNKLSLKKMKIGLLHEH